MRFAPSSRLACRAAGIRISRRDFLTRLGAAAAGTLLVPSANAFVQSLGTERVLHLHNLHTDEEMILVCCPEQRYDQRVLRQFSYLLRDHHTDAVHPMDPGLIDILYAIAVLTRSRGTFQIVSGYRSPETNHMLRKLSHGVAEHSLHMEGKAVDLRMSDVSTRTVHKIALALRYGGVGYYRRTNFVHLDTGRIRSW